MATIVALSSGAPPAGIAVIRVSGPDAFGIVAALARPLPAPRRMALRTLRDAAGDMLDRALVVQFPAAASATGEDVVELHCHGGRAVVAAVVATLIARPGVRQAEAGEFTRRALENGRLDLAQAEGLADLLEAETEAQRRMAMAVVEGRVSRTIAAWMAQLSALSAAVEAAINFAEDEDVAVATASLVPVRTGAAALREAIETVLSAPPVDRLRDGIRVVLGGPPNSGKSTLLNLLADREAAIVSPVAGTTRDRVEVPVRRAGVAYLLIDTAGLTRSDDAIETIGVDRAKAAIREADLLVWLGEAPPPRDDALWVQSRGDLPGRGELKAGRGLLARQDDAHTIEGLWQAIATRAAALLPSPDIVVPLKSVQRDACAAAAADLRDLPDDSLLVAEALRSASATLARIIGVNATETMLDALFGRFCLGK